MMTVRQVGHNENLHPNINLAKFNLTGLVQEAIMLRVTVVLKGTKQSSNWRKVNMRKFFKGKSQHHLFLVLTEVHTYTVQFNQETVRLVNLLIMSRVQQGHLKTNKNFFIKHLVL